MEMLIVKPNIQKFIKSGVSYRSSFTRWFGNEDNLFILSPIISRLPIIGITPSEILVLSHDIYRDLPKEIDSLARAENKPVVVSNRRMENAWSILSQGGLLHNVVWWPVKSISARAVNTMLEDACGRNEPNVFQ